MTERDRQDPPDTPQDAEFQATPQQSEADALRVENEELRDRLLRVMAEMENVRRRMERERQDTAKYAVSNFARDMVGVGDNLRRAIEHVPAEAAANDPALKSFLDGVELTDRELMNVLERHGVVRLEPLGQKFDPNMHQAMFELEDAEKPAGTIVQVMQPGYSIGERCLRPALVGVSKGGTAQTESEAKSDPKSEPKAEAAPRAEPAQPGKQGEPRRNPQQAGQGRPGGRIDRSA